MKRLKLALTLFVVLIANGIGLGQTKGVCGTDEMNQRLIESSEDNKIKYENFLQELTYLAEHPLSSKLGKKAVHTVPVVFHVIHNYGPENISKAQILDQMETINKDFRRLNSDTSKTREIFKGRAADVEVEFKLATKDPNGNCTDGITRTVSTLTYGGDNEVKRLIAWDRKEYLNIWVTNYINLSGADGTIIAGYSFFPWWTDSVENDGIVINHRFVGSIGTSSASNAGRTLTHEIGHWLGVLHPFQNGCGTSNCSNSGDRICDTPPVTKASFGCPTSNNTCSNDSPNEVDNVENYMDYANGTCINMFTTGQKNVMKFYLNDARYRQPNTTSTTHASTGINISNPCAPKADFQVNGLQTICQGGTADFVDLSWNGDVKDRVWTFEGGSPSTSTFDSPTVTYNQAGTYKVTLKVSNDEGESDITRTDYITVLPAVANISSPFIENFDGEFSPFLWTGDFRDPYGWKILDGNSFSGDKAMVGTIDNNTPDGEKFSLYSPNFDLSLHKDLSPVLSMRVAYSLRETGAGERLVIYGSDDCGKNWLALKGLIGASSLKTVQGNNPGWKPTKDSDWKTIEINLDQHGFASSTSFKLKFELTSTSGNSVFIDDINVDQFVLSTPKTKAYMPNIVVYPNPNTGQFTINPINYSENINIEVINPLGELIRTLEVEGDYEQKISIDSPGLYLVKVYNDSFATVKKVVITN